MGTAAEPALEPLPELEAEVDADAEAEAATESAAPRSGGAPQTPSIQAPTAAPPPAIPDFSLSTEDPPEEGAPAWTTTFGDMMSLLLTFFILLFSMSTIEVEKFRDAMNSIHQGFGKSVVDLGEAPPPPPEPVDSAETQIAVSDVVEDKLREIAAALQAFVGENGLEQNIVVDRADDGVYLRIRDAALFEPGGADIEESSAWIVEQLGSVLKGVDVPVTVAGHTDDVPIQNSQFPSNWELSAARAAGVARRLVSIGHDPAEVQVTAFGEYRPIDTNDTADGRARNRRVELFYSRQSVEDNLLGAASSGSARN